MRPRSTMTENERRAFNRGLEQAAKLADLYADENIMMAQDTLLLDPVLMGRDVSSAAVEKSKRLMMEGCIHSSMHHAAKNIAGAIRGLKVSS